MEPYPSFSLVQVRPVKLSDAKHLQLTCWTDRSLNSISDLLARAERFAQSQRGLGAVAVRDDTACAFGMLTLWPRSAEISDLIVSPPFRDQGIGSEIIHFLCDAARRLHAQTLEIGVALTNPRAMALYRRLGFIDHHTINLDLGHGLETVLYLHKPLENP